MTRTRKIGQLRRRSNLRARQQDFLRVLADCGGSRAQAIAACGVPPGTVFRWQSDPWFRERYLEIRQTLAGGAEALRESLSAAAFAMAVGEYRGNLRAEAVRRSLDLVGFAEGALMAAGGARPELDELDAEIMELLGEGNGLTDGRNR